jgi:hypothetical protein
MESPFTIIDNSIDIVGALIFANVVYWSVRYLIRNHLPTYAKIMFVFIVAISSLHLYQVVVQIVGSDFASFRIWDIINYLTALLFLMTVHTLPRKK